MEEEFSKEGYERMGEIFKRFKDKGMGEKDIMKAVDDACKKTVKELKNKKQQNLRKEKGK